MANQFENFIQLELPKRAYLEEDAPKESIIVRRGAGPRQLAGILLDNDQVLVMRDGTLVGLPTSELSGGEGSTGTAVGLSHTEEEPLVQWVVEHNHSSRSVVITVLDENHQAILYDSLYVEDNRITVNFYAPQAGTVNIVFV